MAACSWVIQLKGSRFYPFGPLSAVMARHFDSQRGVGPRQSTRAGLTHAPSS